MVLVGCFNVVSGLVALFRDGYFVVSSDELAIHVDYTTWGWALLSYGIVLALTGTGLLLGQVWAGVVAVILAVFNALFNLAFLPAYPAWSVAIIAFDVLVIYALVVHGRELRPSTTRPGA
jgi:hypothetical protein